VPQRSIEFDPASDDPAQRCARPRDEAAVYFNEKCGIDAMSRQADAVATHHDPVRFTSSYVVRLEVLLHKPVHTTRWPHFEVQHGLRRVNMAKVPGYCPRRSAVALGCR
jgi:hypothetical protein